MPAAFNSVTKAFPPLWLVVWKAPGVTGKSVELVSPATNAWPAPSTATPLARLVAAAEVGAVDEARAGRVQLGREGRAAAEGPARARAGRLEGAGGDGEVRGFRLARDERVARAVHRDAVGPVLVAAAEVGAVDEARAGRVQLGHEGRAAAEGPARARAGRLKGTGGYGEVRGVRVARDEGVARAVHRDAVGLVVVAAAR